MNVDIELAVVIKQKTKNTTLSVFHNAIDEIIDRENADRHNTQYMTDHCHGIVQTIH